MRRKITKSNRRTSIRGMKNRVTLRCGMRIMVALPSAPVITIHDGKMLMNAISKPAPVAVIAGA